MAMKCRVLGAIFVLVHTSMLAQQDSKLAPELRNVSGQAGVNVIVQFTQTPTARHHQKVISQGGTVRGVLRLIKAGSYSVPASGLSILANDPEVAYIYRLTDRCSVPITVRPLPSSTTTPTP